MKIKVALIALGAITLISCKKDLECECTSVFYENGQYSGSQDDIKHTVKDKMECESYEVAIPTETTTCSIDD